MSILGLICVLLALVATLLFVLFMFQRRDLRAISELSLTVQRAVSGERLPQRIEIDPEHETQLDVQALGVSVNQLLLRAARTTGREQVRARNSSPSSASAFTKRCSCIATSSSTPTASSRASSAWIASISSTAGCRIWSRPNTPSWSPRTCAAASPARTAPNASRWRWSGLQGQVSLLELTTAQIDFEGAPALLVTGVEVIPTQEAARARQRQDRREGSRRARRAGRAAAAAAAAARRRRCRCSPCSRWARPSSPPTSKAASCT